MSTFEERPPRPAFGLYKRAIVGALIILLASAGAVSAAILLEVKDDVSIFIHAGRHNRIKGIENVLDPIDPGGPQPILGAGSDPRGADRKTKSPPRSDTIMLIRLDPSKG